MPLTNDYKACEVIDLEPASKHEGPFIVVQTSVEADDPMQTRRLFLLRRDGVWVEYATQILRHPERRCDLCYHTLAEIINQFERLPPRVATELAELTPAQRADWARQEDAAGGPLNYLHRDLQQWCAANTCQRD